MTRLVFTNGPELKVLTLHSEAEQARGLSHLPSLPEDQGVLFVSPVPKFWELHTRLMNFPLDFVFFQHEVQRIGDFEYAGELVVANTVYDVIPGRSDIHSGIRVRFVLEINGGFLKKHDIKWGQRAVLVNGEGTRYVL